MGENQCIRKSIRVSLFIINLFYMLVAVGIVAVGIYILVDRNDLTVLVGQSVTAVGAVTMVVGLGVFMTAILGLTAAVSNLKAVLSTYAFFLAIFICIQITATVLAFVYRGRAAERISVQMVDYIRNYTTSADTSYNEKSNAAIDLIQNTFECCGRDGPSDWVRYNLVYLAGNGYPQSCECIEDNTNDNICFSLLYSNGRGIWTRGCNETVYNFVETNLAVFGSVAAILGAIVILTFIFSLILFGLNVSARRK